MFNKNRMDSYINILYQDEQKLFTTGLITARGVSISTIGTTMRTTVTHISTKKKKKLQRRIVRFFQNIVAFIIISNSHYYTRNSFWKQAKN